MVAFCKGARLNKTTTTMTQLFTTLALLCFSSALVNAQAPTSASDPAAKKILDQVSAKFRSYKTVKAAFTLTIENGNGKVDGRKMGTVTMKGTEYHISMPGQEIFCDGTNTWTLDKSSNEVKIDKVDLSAGTITPQKLFTDFYNKDFLYKMDDDTKVNGKSASEIELTPFDKTKPFFKVLVDVDKISHNIVSTKVYEKNGTRFTYSVNTFSYNSPTITDASFVFDQTKYPGVEVVDLR
jgi:outer membrane lipoprotein carrier protein